MATARDTHGSVFKNGSAILLARIVDNAGQTITNADVSSIRYTVYEVDEKLPNAGDAVMGHDQAVLASSSVIFDTLQTGPIWTADTTGYNFRHEIDVSVNEAFPKSGTSYLVRYQLTPTSGQKVIFRFLLRAI